MSGLVAGKLAFVTGAGSGIGRATCQVLAREGATIIAGDRNLNSAKETIDLIKNKCETPHSALELNVQSSENVQTALQYSLDNYKNPPSIIINCAGITKDNFLLKMPETDFDEVINVNLKGTFLITKIFANAIVTNNVRNSSIINLASIVGKYGNMGQANYCASKAAVEAFTKTTAKEFGKFGIRCNSVLPGFIKSPMTETVPQKVQDMIITNIPIGRLGQTNEVAEVIVFLACDRSSYINGASIEVTGGL